MSEVTSTRPAADVARSFVDRVNAHDVAGVMALTTDDHVFVDATGAVHPRAVLRQGWTQYFAAFPDYRVDIDEAIGDGPVVVLLGQASGTFAGDAHARGLRAFRIPAAFKATVRGDRLAEWRVYCDVEPMLRAMGLDRFGGAGGPVISP